MAEIWFHKEVAGGIVVEHMALILATFFRFFHKGPNFLSVSFYFIDPTLHLFHFIN